MAKRTFTLFHLSLKEIRQKDIETISLNRIEWLRLCLETSFTFKHRNIEYHWVAKGPLRGHIFGVIQRKRRHEFHLPPDQGGGEITKDEWIGAYVIIDPTNHEEGQRLAFENDVVGDPDKILKSLFQNMNNRPESPFVINSSALFSPSEFWNFAERNDFKLRNIDFQFIAPNMWGTRNALEEDLKETRDQTNANEIDVKLKSEDGLNADSQIVADGVEYVTRGSGRIKAQGMNGEKFDSEDDVTTTSIPKDEENAEETRGIFTRLLDIIMGRADDEDQNDLE